MPQAIQTDLRLTVASRGCTGRVVCTHCGNQNAGDAKFCPECGVLLKDVSLTAGSHLDADRYEVVRLIKSGGMGAVYLVNDTRLVTQCALKEMIDFSPTPDERKAAVERFQNEVKLLSTLSHSSLPQVTNFFIERGHYYMVMDYIDGSDLDSLIRSEGSPGLSESFARFVGMEICKVLEYLHDQSPPILNRDIKPSNIMISKSGNRVYLVDFGIARSIAPTPYKKTAIGTEGYAPLEQYRGYPEPRSDLYALGATLYQVMTGKEIKALDFPPIRTINPQVSEEMEGVLAKALELYPENRYASARAMRAALSLTGEDRKVSGGARKTSILSREPAFTAPLAGERTSPEQKVAQAGDEKPAFERKAAPVPDERQRDYAANSILKQIAELTGPPKPRMKKRFSTLPVMIEGKDGAPMVLVEAGTFVMGTSINDSCYSKASRDEMPHHNVYVEDFYMDLYPVTNLLFSRFVEATGYKTVAELREELDTWQTFYTEGKESHPVVCINWFDADQYASWAEKRLPRETEWEKAARGTDRRDWPWGGVFNAALLNSAESGRNDTSPVDAFPGGASPYGVLDMAGNVREWTIDWYRPYPYRGPYSSGYLKSIRGSSFADTGEECRCARRWENVPNHRDRLKGFRCIFIPS
jgi:formylglycine-generating enzyme required for sulfatase activity/predicted Ser/Thr protein kinase